MKTKILIFLVIVNIGCTERKTASNNVLDYISDTSTISIDINTEPYTRTLQYFQGDLYWWNSNRGSISIFDLSKKTLKKTIKLEEEGPNGLGMPLGFYVSNKDSIYIPTMAYQLALINSDGKILHKYEYIDHSKLGGVFVSMTRFSNSIQEDSQGTYYFLMSDLENILPSEINITALNEYPPILTFNQHKEIFEYLEFKAPKKLLDYNDAIDFGLTSTSSSLILLHDQSNSAFIIDFNGKNYKEFTLKSNLLQNFSNEYWISPRMSKSPDSNIELMYKTSKNLGLIFDQYNNLLFRFGWPGEDISDDKDKMKFGYTPRYFTISIYNPEDFSLIKEFVLPKNTYLSHHYFIDENGLNLFPMHPDNPNLKEGELIYHTFNFNILK